MTIRESPSAWTVGEIANHLGISTAVYQKRTIGAGEIARIREAGISRIELSMTKKSVDYHDRRQISEIGRECQKRGVVVVSVHGRLDLPYLSEDPGPRKLVIDESLACLRVAEELGALIYVGHFGGGDVARRNLTDLLSRTEGFGVRLTVENMSGSLDGYLPVLEAMDSDRLGMTLDIGHARDPDGVNPFTKKDGARRAVARAGKRLFHLHLHETLDLAEKPDHRPPLHEKGIIRWGEVFAGLKDADYRGELMFEDGRGESPEEWVRMVAEFPREFVRRYGGR